MFTKIWYSVQNCGDGSAYPQLMESEELAELDQNHMDEGWGEPCVGCITIEHNSAIIIVDKIVTVDDMIDEIQSNWDSPDDKYFPIERYEALKKLKEKINVL